MPVYAFAFGCAAYGGMQLPARLFPKLTYSKFEGVNHAYYTSSQDVVGKFRLFDTVEELDSRQDITNYLSVYSTQPVTKNEMLDNLALQALKEFDLGEMFRVKRAGKDRDDLFWSFGKIHGLENLAFVDQEAVRKTNGNPVKIQRLVNEADRGSLPADSFEHLIQELEVALADYKQKVESLGMNPSDRKKVLALPFFLAKRSQQPEPREGQPEFELFKQLTGRSWYSDARTVIDPEHKITEFEWERFIDPSLISRDTAASPEFKRVVRTLNILSRTEDE